MPKAGVGYKVTKGTSLHRSVDPERGHERSKWQKGRFCELAAWRGFDDQQYQKLRETFAQPFEARIRLCLLLCATHVRNQEGTSVIEGESIMSPLISMIFFPSLAPSKPSSY